jgi:membrane-bound ClpP family serine protease
MPQGRRAIKRSEIWISGITGAGALLTALLTHAPGAVPWVGFFVSLLCAGVLAFWRTVGEAKVPGVGTKAFWGVLVTVLGAMWASLAEIEIPGVSPEALQTGAVGLSGVVAVLYHFKRVLLKVKALKAEEEDTKP